MHPDYAEILKAVEQGVPVIIDWSLKGRLRDGYTLSGHLDDGTSVTGKVTSQEGNFITLDDTTRYLVIWWNIELKGKEKWDVMFDGKYCDLVIKKDFSRYMYGEHRRPDLMGK